MLVANDPSVDVSYQVDAARDALPYFHRKLPEIEGPVVLPDLGPCETANQIIEAQTKVMQLMTKGQIPSAVGKVFIESLALMVRTRDLAIGPANGTLQVIGLGDHT